MDIKFYINNYKKTWRVGLRNEILRKGVLSTKFVGRVKRETIMMVWQCKKNG